MGRPVRPHHRDGEGARLQPAEELTQKQLANVVTWMRKIRQNSRVIAASLGDLADILTKGDAIITTQSNEVVAEEIRAKGKPANWATPKEGTWGWCDQFCLPKQAPNPTGAYAYIDAILYPKANAQMSMDLAEATPVGAAVKYLNKATKSIYGYGNISQSLDHFGFYFLPPLGSRGTSPPTRTGRPRGSRSRVDDLVSARGSVVLSAT